MNEAENIDIVSRLETFLEELQDYQGSRLRLRKRKRLRNDEVTRFNELFDDIGRKVGAFGSRITELTGMDRVVSGQKEYDMWFMGLRLDFDPLTDSALEICIHATNRAIGKLKSEITEGIRDKQGKLVESQRKFVLEPPRAFIAHEEETEQLRKLKDFLEALGIEYFIAEAKASDGRSIERQVDWTQAKADFAICLATKGKAINRKTGKHYMGLNIADELGRARQVFRNRIILLVQKGVEVHTNIKEIVHAPFTTQSMDIAFTKVIKELRNWGFIKVGKIEE